MLPTNRPPTHPGEILRVEFLEALGMSQSELARRIGIGHPQSINEICNRKRGVSAEMALLLAKAFGTTPEFWMNLQSSWELYEARAAIPARRLAAIEAVVAG